MVDSNLINDNEFQVKVKEDRSTYKIVKFFTPQCSYCRYLKHVIDKLKHQKQWNFKLFDLNCQWYPQFCMNNFHIPSFPYTAIFNKQGDLIQEIRGFYPEPVIREIFSRIDKLNPREIQNNSDIKVQTTNNKASSLSNELTPQEHKQQIQIHQQKNHAQKQNNLIVISNTIDIPQIDEQKTDNNHQQIKIVQKDQTEIDKTPQSISQLTNPSDTIHKISQQKIANQEQIHKQIVQAGDNDKNDNQIEQEQIQQIKQQLVATLDLGQDYQERKIQQQVAKQIMKQSPPVTINQNEQNFPIYKYLFYILCIGCGGYCFYNLVIISPVETSNSNSVDHHINPQPPTSNLQDNNKYTPAHTEQVKYQEQQLISSLADEQL